MYYYEYMATKCHEAHVNPRKMRKRRMNGGKFLYEMTLLRRDKRERSFLNNIEKPWRKKLLAQLTSQKTASCSIGSRCTMPKEDNRRKVWRGKEHVCIQNYRL